MPTLAERGGKKTRSSFPDSRWDDEAHQDVIGFVMKSRLLKIWHASEKRVGSVPCGSPWDPEPVVKLAARTQLGGEGGLEAPVETSPRNMEGNVCQLFVDLFPSLGGEGLDYCTLSMMTVCKITLRGPRWLPHLLH